MLNMSGNHSVLQISIDLTLAKPQINAHHNSYVTKKFGFDMNLWQSVSTLGLIT